MSAANERSISPPPSKRRRFEKPSALAPTMPLRPVQPLQPSSFRIFSWNVNGIAPFLQPSITSFFKVPKKRARTPSPGEKAHVVKTKTYSLRQCLERWQWPHVVCLQEVKIRESDQETMKAVQQAVKAPKHASQPDYKAYFSLPKDKMNVRAFGGKMYGVCTLVRENVLESDRGGDEEVSVLPVDWEREGRVLAMRLPKRQLLVINVYAVNGTDYPWKSASGAVIGTRHDYKRKFHSQLRDMVRKYNEDGWNTVIAGDLNIARGPVDGFPGIRLGNAHVQNRKDFDHKFIQDGGAGDVGLGMIDSFRELHGDERKYTYRSPGIEWGASCDRVDLILLTTGLVQEPSALVEADILDDEHERGPSDHLPLFVTLDFSNIDAKRGHSIRDAGSDA